MANIENTSIDQFFNYMEELDVEGIKSITNSGATVHIRPLNIKGEMVNEGVSFFKNLFYSFPDLLITQKNQFLTKNNLAVCEIKLEGTQSKDFYGIINQKKHIDSDQVWTMKLENSKISDISALWCQNQFLRRLAVKNLNKIRITEKD